MTIDIVITVMGGLKGRELDHNEKLFPNNDPNDKLACVIPNSHTAFTP